MNALIADDELVSRKKMQKIMESFGESTTVETGADAVTTFKESLRRGKPFDLVTLDIMMPDMDGLRALMEIRDAERKNWIKTGDEHPQVKIMMVTSHSKKELVLGCVKAGANSFVVKPFDRDIIIEKLKEMGFSV